MCSWPNDQRSLDTCSRAARSVGSRVAHARQCGRWEELHRSPRIMSRRSTQSGAAGAATESMSDGLRPSAHRHLGGRRCPIRRAASRRSRRSGLLPPIHSRRCRTRRRENSRGQPGEIRWTTLTIETGTSSERRAGRAARSVREAELTADRRLSVCSLIIARVAGRSSR